MTNVDGAIEKEPIVSTKEERCERDGQWDYPLEQRQFNIFLTEKCSNTFQLNYKIRGNGKLRLVYDCRFEIYKNEYLCGNEEQADFSASVRFVGTIANRCDRSEINYLV